MNLRRALISSVVVIALACVGLSVGLSFAPSSVALDEWRDLQDVDSPAEGNLLLSYQGHLLDKNGTPISSGSVPMVFAIYPQPSGGTSCWEETHSGGNAVEVQDGAFHAILGQYSAIPTSCAASEAYLQLTVNGEVMSPRERLTSVATAGQAMRLPNGGRVDGDLIVKQSIRTEAGNNALTLVNDYGTTRLSAASSIFLFIDSDNEQEGATFRIFANAGSVNPPVKSLLAVSEAGDTWIARDLAVGRNLSLTGDCTVGSQTMSSSVEDAVSCTGGTLTTGGIVEANLQTSAELRSKSIDRFVEGDVLCWVGDHLEKCVQENDRLVQAVASKEGKPFIVGAENILVLGPVEMGDILVSSEVPGHAMVNNNPLPGTVIGQALESFEGESGLIKAMIRKW